ncbi:hypothetical protein DAMA08_010360 [Martiniozyma asiatica (nom. inval.)]|nr:hypothetical protein DAMA08_010360 [Martiniozyma asiatica]
MDNILSPFLDSSFDPVQYVDALSLHPQSLRPLSTILQHQSLQLDQQFRTSHATLSEVVDDKTVDRLHYYLATLVDASRGVTESIKELQKACIPIDKHLDTIEEVRRIQIEKDNISSVLECFVILESVLDSAEDFELAEKQTLTLPVFKSALNILGPLLIEKYNKAQDKSELSKIIDNLLSIESMFDELPQFSASYKSFTNPLKSLKNK